MIEEFSCVWVNQNYLKELPRILKGRFLVVTVRVPKSQLPSRSVELLCLVGDVCFGRLCVKMDLGCHAESMCMCLCTHVFVYTHTHTELLHSSSHGGTRAVSQVWRLSVLLRSVLLGQASCH